MCNNLEVDNSSTFCRTTIMYSNVAESAKSRAILPKQRSTQPRTRDQASHFYSVTSTHLFASSKTPFEAENENMYGMDAVPLGHTGQKSK